MHSAIYRHCHHRYTVDLGHQAVRALQLAAQAGATIQSICRALGCAANTGSEIIRRLAEKGLVQKQRRVTDERVVEVRATPEGARVLAEQSGLDTGKLARRLGDRTPEECEQIKAGLLLLLTCVSGAERC